MPETELITRRLERTKMSVIPQQTFYDLVQKMDRHLAGANYPPDEDVSFETLQGEFYSLLSIKAELERRRKKFWIEIKTVKADGVEPPLFVYEVTIFMRGGTWTRSFGTAELTEAFLQGVEAAVFITKQIRIFVPPVPRPR